MDPLRNGRDRTPALARGILRDMRHATLAVNDPQSGHPHMARISCQIGANGLPIALIADISAHSHALEADPRAGLFVGTIQEKGDPMTWPRLALRVSATLLPPDETLRARWIARDPKAKIYATLPGFRFWRLTPVSGFMNAGFGAAFRLAPADLIVAR